MLVRLLLLHLLHLRLHRLRLHRLHRLRLRLHPEFLEWVRAREVLVGIVELV